MKRTTIDKQFYKLLGEKLTDARKNKGYKLRDVSKEIGKTVQAIDLYELGQSRISKDDFLKLCKLYELNGKIRIEITLE